MNNYLNWIANLPLWQATLFLAVCSFFREQMMYWIGKLSHKGLLKTKWGKREDAGNQAGIQALEKYGWPIIPLSFLTIGFQSVVQFGAGLMNMSWQKYTLAAIPGYLIWGFIYASGGLALFRSITHGSIGLFITFVMIVLAVILVANWLPKYLRRTK